MRILAAFLAVAAFASAQSATPFTLVEVSRRFDKAGNLRSEARFLFAVNREGSVVSMDLDPAAGGLRQIRDVARGDILVDPRTASASLLPRPTPQRPVQGPCEQRFLAFRDARIATDKAAGTILGVEVQRVSVDWPDGSGMDVFMAPSLGCQMLRTVARRDGRTLERSLAETLQLGDPDPALFEVPPGYRQSTVTMQWSRPEP